MAIQLAKSEDTSIKTEAQKRQFINEMRQLAVSELQEGKWPEDIIRDLVGHGVEEERAHSIVDGLLGAGNQTTTYDPFDESAVYDEETAPKSGQHEIIEGGIALAIGLGITIITYKQASSGGGSYVVAWGAILFGAIELIKGLIKSIK
ncbi:MAG: hypothetical protein K6F96_02425 [Bacteroidales bacterium]|nr:hypothetical protein [Bacteroidales bacterium]